jgi:hypothetical protein
MTEKYVSWVFRIHQPQKLRILRHHLERGAFCDTVSLFLSLIHCVPRVLSGRVSPDQSFQFFIHLEASRKEAS